jgi:hypothetical protein
VKKLPRSTVVTIVHPVPMRRSLNFTSRTLLDKPPVDGQFSKSIYGHVSRATRHNRLQVQLPPRQYRVTQNLPT